MRIPLLASAAIALSLMAGAPNQALASTGWDNYGPVPMWYGYGPSYTDYGRGYGPRSYYSAPRYYRGVRGYYGRRAYYGAPAYYYGSPYYYQPYGYYGAYGPGWGGGGVGFWIGF